MVALERSGALLNKVSNAFFNVLSADATDEMMEISQRVSPKLSESSNYIYLNDKLFARIKENSPICAKLNAAIMVVLGG